MSSVIIDGYNVIGTDHRDAEKVREVFISRLIAYRKATGHDITVVFDAYNRGSLRETAAVLGGVKVIFTRHGDRADDVIKKKWKLPARSMRKGGGHGPGDGPARVHEDDGGHGSPVLGRRSECPERWSPRGTIEIPEAEKIVITFITDNYCDQIRPDDRIAKRHRPPRSVLDGALHAEHGLAYHAETVVAGRPHSFLFDFATDVHGVKRNLDLLEIDLRALQALVLSHDHFDHQAALVDLLEAKRDEIPKGIPFYVGERFFQGTYWRTPDGHVMDLLGLNKEDIEKLALVRIVEVRDPTPIVAGAVSTGRIEQVTEYERVPSVFVAKKGDQFVQEDFIGEQAMVLNAKGKGLVVLSGCAHRGIVNAVKQAQAMTGLEQVHAIIGGFHLTGARPEVIRRTIADIRDKDRIDQIFQTFRPTIVFHAAAHKHVPLMERKSRGASMTSVPLHRLVPAIWMRAPLRISLVHGAATGQATSISHKAALGVIKPLASPNRPR